MEGLGAQFFPWSPPLTAFILLSSPASLFPLFQHMVAPVIPHPAPQPTSQGLGGTGERLFPPCNSSIHCETSAKVFAL